MLKKRLLALVLAGLFVLSACSGEEEPTPSPDESEEPTASVEPSPDVPEEYSGPLNPLTNLPMSEDFVGKRPLAVMLSNIRGAQPQQGVVHADIIYEVLAEGGITRMLGIFQEYDQMEMTGSVRSTRPYYLDLAQGHDAILLHAGGSEEAYRQISSRSITALDCVNGPYEGSLFWRDADRRANNGYTHSVVTSGEKIMEYFPGYSFRQEHDDGYAFDMTFADEVVLDGETAAEITVPFSSAKTGYFRYDSEAGQYMISQSLDQRAETDYIDGNTKEQIGVSNVLVLFADHRSLDSEDRQAVTLTGSGTGYFATGGTYIPITWEKPSYASQFTYYNESGEAITFTTGKTFINIVRTGNSVTFE